MSSIRCDSPGSTFHPGRDAATSDVCDQQSSRPTLPRTPANAFLNALHLRQITAVTHHVFAAGNSAGPVHSLVFATRPRRSRPEITSAGLFGPGRILRWLCRFHARGSGNEHHLIFAIRCPCFRDFNRLKSYHKRNARFCTSPLQARPPGMPFAQPGKTKSPLP